MDFRDGLDGVQVLFRVHLISLALSKRLNVLPRIELCVVAGRIPRRKGFVGDNNGNER